MIKPPARYYDDFTARSRLFGKQRDYSHGYRVIRIRGGKDENLNVRDGNRSSKKTRITLTNFPVIRAPSCFLFLFLLRSTNNVFPVSFLVSIFSERCIDLVRSRRQKLYVLSRKYYSLLQLFVFYRDFLSWPFRLSIIFWLNGGIRWLRALGLDTVLYSTTLYSRDTFLR